MEIDVIGVPLDFGAGRRGVAMRVGMGVSCWWFCSVIDPLLATGLVPSWEQDEGWQARWMSLAGRGSRPRGGVTTDPRPASGAAKIPDDPSNRR